jgi:hypothetical protein
MEWRGEIVSKTLDIPSDSTVFKRLRMYNGAMGLLHLVQGLAMIVLSNSFSLPIYANFGKYNLATGALDPNPELFFDLRIGPAVGTFLLISAIAHFLVSTILYDWYVEKLKHKINYIRWYEYAFSSSIMLVVIAMLTGMSDFPALVMLFSLNAIMNLFGLIMELHNQTTTRTNWTAFVYGCIAGGVPWLMIAFTFIGVGLDNAIPTFVYFIEISIFIFFNIFALNMVLQYKQVGRWKDYLHGERVYILLSLVAKTLLAWQVFAGTLRG